MDIINQLLPAVGTALGQAVYVAPWIVLVIVYLGEKRQQRQVIDVLKDALSRAQDAAHGVPPSPAPQPPVTVTPPAPPQIQSPPTAPSATGPFASYPSWFQWAANEIGFHETGNNQGIGRYIALGKCGTDGDPWCAIFANAALESSGVIGTKSPSSQSFRTDPNFVPLTAPAPGALAVFWRGSKDSGLGHVGFYRGENATQVWVLGGNEDDMVQIEALSKNSATFGLIGYWWPKGVPLPKTGAVSVPAGYPAHIQSPPTGASASAPAAANGLQSNIVATMFGGQQSAYGGAINDSAYGIALPYRFSGARPQVEVSNPKTGVSITCDIVDVGPWNINDPYWETGTRPQAESGTDSHGRHTNRAGIDLTFAAAKALGVDGKGVVNWKFLTAAAASAPKMT